MKRIENHSPYINFNSANKIIKKCLKSSWVSTGGNLVKEFENKISKFTGAKYTVACNSGTAALQIALKLSGVEKDDEVIVPTLTFIATINSVIYNQSSPIFMDCDDYFNLDIKKTIEFLNKKTIFRKGYTVNKKTGKRIKAVMPVHVWGNGIDTRELKKICDKKKINIIEDSTEALGTFIYKNKKKIHAGLQGLAGCLSFNANKIITTGGGGAIITNNKKIAEEALYLTTQAKDDSIKFVHNEIGYNYRLTSLSAALGISQINEINKKLKIKKKIYNFYKKKFNNNKNYNIAKVPNISLNNHWMNILQINSNKKGLKDKLVKKLIKKGIQVRPVWKLNHEQKPFKNFEKYKISKALKLFDKSICLPSGIDINQKKINFILKELIKS